MVKDDIELTKQFINGIAQVITEDKETLYTTNIYWGYIMRRLPLALKQQLHLAAIKNCRELQKEFDEL